MALAIKRDFRKLAPETQAELRRVAVGMVAAGTTRLDAAAAVGVNRRFVGEWVKASAQSGEAALAGRRRGRRPGEQRALTATQESRLRDLITSQCPDQLQLPFALWTREAVQALLARESGVRLALPVVGRYLRRWGFTPQRPIRRASERREAEIQAWLDTEYPAIAARAKAEGGEIQWADETGLSNQANYGRSFAPEGETPVIPRPAKRFAFAMIASLTNRGTLRFMIYEGALNAALFLTFLRRLIRDAPRKVFLIVDNLKVHHAQAITRWVREHRDRLELFYLPPYAPEHNPEEFLNNDLKQTLARHRTPKTKLALKSGLTSYMRSLQRQPAKVRTFFQAPSVRYAA
jgi:transposase